jgi:hypothetical protein
LHEHTGQFGQSWITHPARYTRFSRLALMLLMRRMKLVRR